MIHETSERLHNKIETTIEELAAYEEESEPEDEEGATPEGRKSKRRRLSIKKRRTNQQ